MTYIQAIQSVSPLFLFISSSKVCVEPHEVGRPHQEMRSPVCELVSAVMHWRSANQQGLRMLSASAIPASLRSVGHCVGGSAQRTRRVTK